MYLFKLCQFENERFGQNYLSIKRELVKPETIKSDF